MSRTRLPRIDGRRAARIRALLIAWYLRHRRDLPWRRTHDPYRILVSEIMLQQTQVDRVIPKYLAWLERFPTVAALAAARPRDVLLAWEGMGYNRRALYLHRAAQRVMTEFSGTVPTDIEALRTLPGVGPYTAAAVATFATGLPHAFADTNVERVLLRLFVGHPIPDHVRADAVQVMERTMPRHPLRGVPPGHWGHLLMDFGALVCKARPRCEVCPLQRSCRAYPQILSLPRTRVKPDTQVPDGRPHPDRIYRGRIVQYVRERDPAAVALRDIAPAIFPGYTTNDAPWFQGLVRGLLRDGLLVQEGRRHAVRLPT